MIEYYKKIKKKGLRWIFWRIGDEILNPKILILKTIIDIALNTKKKLFNKKIINEKKYLYAIYDLEISPITYNIVEYLCIAEIESSKLEKNGFIIVFVPKKNNENDFETEYNKIINNDSSNWRVDNILIQTSRLSEKCKGILILPDRDSVKEVLRNNETYPYLYDGINLRYADVEHFYKSVDKPGRFIGLKASIQGKNYINKYIKENGINKKIITIIIRNYGYDISRNSKLNEWVEFFKYLKLKNFYPIVIPDTDDAFNQTLPFDEKHIFREACWNVGLRMALYEASYINLSVVGGAGAIALFNSSCSVIMMNMLPEGSTVTTIEAYQKIGYEIGEKWRFLSPKQKLSFLPDTFENIKFEFDDFIKNIND